MSAEIREFAPEEVLGELNEVERKYAPGVLFAEGDLGLLSRTPCVAMAGTREVSEEGADRAQRLARLLVKRGVTVVSGLARGVDTIAHSTAIESGGRTVAVLGTPLGKCSPAANRGLLDEIKAKHLALSQFAEGSRTGRWCFPARNRTMALVSQASVIVEAAERGGTLSQGWEAIRLGRPLFILKSNFERPGLTWPQEMLKYGAMELADDDDLFDLLAHLPTWQDLRDDVLSA